MQPSLINIIKCKGKIKMHEEKRNNKKNGHQVLFLMMKSLLTLESSHGLAIGLE
jgi:hypothetical protein